MAQVELIGFVVAVAAVVASWELVRLARSGQVARRWLTALACAFGIGLAIIVVTDWPGEWMSEFWAEHSVVAGILSTLLLAGAGILAIEVRQLEVRDELANAMAGTAFAGLVGPLLDVDIALALLAGEHHDGLRSGLAEKGKPLRWIRNRRERPGDPWPEATTHPFASLDPAVDVEVLAHCTRRTVGAARDWAALAATAPDGRAVLAGFGSIRNHLAELESVWPCQDRDLILNRWAELRADVQQTIVVLEFAAGSPVVRPHLEGLPTEDLRGLISSERFATIEKIRQSIGSRDDTPHRSVRNLLPPDRPPLPATELHALRNEEARTIDPDDAIDAGNPRRRAHPHGAERANGV